MSASSSVRQANFNKNKYGNLLKQPWIKKLRDYYFDLFTYMDTVVPNLFPMHEVISVWRMLQFIIPCLCAANNLIWESDKPIGLTVSIISVFGHIIPVDYRKDSSVIVEFFYCAINILFFVAVITSAFYYKKTAKLPTHIPSIISVYINTFGYLIHPINLNLVGEAFGRLINGEALHLSLFIEILSIVLSLFCFCMWFWFFDQISVVSFLFRPNSLISVLGSTQTFIFITTNLVTFILAIASQISKYPSAVLTFASAIIYLVGLTSVYTPGSFISSTHKRLVFSCSISSCIFTFLMGVYIIIERKATFAELFVYVLALIIVYIISFFVLKRSLRKQMKFLDDVHSNTISIENIKRPDLVVKYGITGIQFDHPICLNWRIFRLGTDKWPMNVKIWVTFAKFVAIYPSENQLLSHIIYTMEANKLKGNLARQTIQQARNVYMQRESSLSAGLKSKMNRCTKNVQVTKRKIRHVWDLAIQGSINEMEASINTAYNSVIKTRSYYNHLISQYPNNRFVARSYLHFIIDIECDPQKTVEWSEKVNHLHRGIQVNLDRTNLLGIHSFPCLPPSMSDNLNHPAATDNESYTGDTENVTDEGTQSVHNEANEKISVIRDHIEKIRIPATTCIKIWNIFLYLVLLFLPSVIFMVILPKYLSGLEDVLFYEYHLSYLRALAVVIPVFSNHYLCEQIGFYPEPLYNMLPESFGRKNKTDEMLRHLLKAVSIQVEELNTYRSFKKDDKLVHPVHTIVFGGTIPLKNYINQSVTTNSTSTLQGAMSEVIMSAAKLAEIVKAKDCKANPDECWKLMNTRDFLNPYMNYGLLVDSITNALINMNEFLVQNYRSVENMCMFICLFISVVYALIIIGILIYQLESLQKCKKSVYKCLTSLPKNVVSAVSESLKMMKKLDSNENESDKVEIDTELNKQDENILKIFSSVGDASSMKSHDKTVLIVCTVFLLICALICTFVLGLSFPEIAKKLNNNSPHMGFILGSTGFGFSAVAVIDNLILISNGHGITGSVKYVSDDPSSDQRSSEIRDIMVEYARTAITTFTTYIHNARYGRSNGKVGPYPLFENAVNEANENLEGCEDYNSLEGPPKYYSCLPVDVQLNIYKAIVQTIITPIGDNYENDYQPTSEMVQQLWNIMTIGLCNKFMYPMFGGIVPEVQRILNDIIPPAQAIVIIVLILAFIDLIIIIAQFLNSETKMRFALSFLLQCPPTTVMQSTKTMEILCGNFSSGLNDSSGHNSQFFDSIVQSIPDSVIVCNMNYKVLNANKSTERIYGVKTKDIIDKDACEFFTNEKYFVGSEIKELFEKGEGNIETEFKKPDDSNKCFLNITVSQMGEQYVIETRDVTQTVLYNTLIAEERVKSDRLLSSILPPNLVKRVQDGEKNISFGVQSATILFLDIVEFTPWCASNTAAMVMSTLNTLFRKYDENLATHPTLTKIKCIGDCYMCSGGIFVEINQPAIHAKETVEFGLEAISSIEENNKEMNLSLRIRVGINTGGPIVAGVLGTEKPTFEILGPAINMAQQMEQHGVPMKVHISRTTYELIYGGNFVIKERGQVEIKKGSVLTYLVESKK